MSSEIKTPLLDIKTPVSSVPVDPDAKAPPSKSLSAEVAETLKSKFVWTHPDVHFPEIRSVADQAEEELYRSYRFKIKPLDVAQPLQMKFEPSGLGLLLVWIIHDKDVVKDPPVYWRYRQRVIANSSRANDGNVLITLRSVSKGLPLVEDVLREMKESGVVVVEKVSPTLSEQKKVEQELEQKEQELKIRTEKQQVEAQQRERNLTLPDLPPPLPFEQTDYKQRLSIVPQGLKEEDFDKALSKPVLRDSGKDSKPSSAEDRVRASNAEGAKRFQREHIHELVARYYEIVRQNFWPFVRLDTAQTASAILCVNDVQREFENSYASIVENKGFMIHVFVSTPGQGEEEVSLTCVKHATPVRIFRPNELGFFAIVKDLNGRFVIDTTMVGHQEEPYRSWRLISETVDAFVNQLNEGSHHKVKRESAVEAPRSQADKRNVQKK